MHFLQISILHSVGCSVNEMWKMQIITIFPSPILWLFCKNWSGKLTSQSLQHWRQIGHKKPLSVWSSTVTLETGFRTNCTTVRITLQLCFEFCKMYFRSHFSGVCDHQYYHCFVMLNICLRRKLEWPQSPLTLVHSCRILPQLWFIIITYSNSWIQDVNPQVLGLLDCLKATQAVGELVCMYVYTFVHKVLEGSIVNCLNLMSQVNI